MDTASALCSCSRVSSTRSFPASRSHRSTAAAVELAMRDEGTSRKIAVVGDDDDGQSRELKEITGLYSITYNKVKCLEMCSIRL